MPMWGGGGGGVVVEGLWLLAFDVFVLPNKFEVKLLYYIFDEWSCFH